MVSRGLMTIVVKRRTGAEKVSDAASMLEMDLHGLMRTEESDARRRSCG
jgi:hypothetical protein